MKNLETYNQIIEWQKQIYDSVDNITFIKDTLYKQYSNMGLNDDYDKEDLIEVYNILQEIEYKILQLNNGK